MGSMKIKSKKLPSKANKKDEENNEYQDDFYQNETFYDYKENMSGT